jgi:hypothetical protein
MKKKLLTVTLKFQSCGVMNGLQMSTFHPNPFHFTRLAILLSQSFTNAIARSLRNNYMNAGNWHF